MWTSPKYRGSSWGQGLKLTDPQIAHLLHIYPTKNNCGFSQSNAFSRRRAASNPPLRRPRQDAQSLNMPWSTESWGLPLATPQSKQHSEFVIQSISILNVSSCTCWLVKTYSLYIHTDAHRLIMLNPQFGCFNHDQSTSSLVKPRVSPRYQPWSIAHLLKVVATSAETKILVQTAKSGVVLFGILLHSYWKWMNNDEHGPFIDL